MPDIVSDFIVYTEKYGPSVQGVSKLSGDLGINDSHKKKEGKKK